MKWTKHLLSTTVLWWAQLTVAMGGVIAYFYGHILAAPNDVLLVNGGDGMKNYFTLAWHVRHDGSALHYTGSGFPYGEQVFFTDGHPLLSWLLQALPFLAPYAVGILNTLLLLGPLACAWCLFAVLRHLRLAPWAAAVGALGLTMLQPQLFRLGGHLSLAHAWMIPLFFLVLIRSGSSPRWLKWGILTGVVVLVDFLTHPYIGLMGVLLVLGYCAMLLPFQERWRDWRNYLRPVIGAIIPMLVFLILLGWGDSTTDRPTTPQTTDKFGTTLLSLIVPTHDPFVTPLREFIRYDAIDWETWCYLGLSSVFVLVIAGAMQLKRWTMHAEAAPVDPASALFGAGFLVLLFAMGVWQDWFGEWLPTLAQFRCAGRFAWVFYFACGVFCTVRLYQWLFVEGVRKPVAVAVFLVVIGFYAVEGWAYHVDVSRSLGQTANTFRQDLLSAEQETLVHQAIVSKAVVIVPLPCMHEGSEVYQKDAPKSAMAAYLPLAYNSGIPIMAGITSRTSLQDTRDLLALRAPSFFAKQLASKFPPDAIVLLFHTGDPLEPDEQALWDMGSGDGALRTVLAKTLFTYDGKERSAEYERMKGFMPQEGEWQVKGADTGLIHQRQLEGNNLVRTIRDFTELFFAPPGLLDSSRTYELSCEFHAMDQAMNVSVVLEHVRSDGSDLRWEPLRNVRSMPMQSTDSRAIATYTFTPLDKDRSYKFFLKGPDDMGQRYSVSHILLRPVTVDAWREGTWEGGPTVFLNNVPLTPLSAAPAP